MTMKLHYDPETASLYIELNAAPSAETREVSDGVNVDLDGLAQRGRMRGVTEVVSPLIRHGFAVPPSPASREKDRAPGTPASLNTEITA